MKVLLFFAFTVLQLAIVNPAVAQDPFYHQVTIEEYGEPAVMKVVKRTVLPEPGAGEVRVKVLSASVSFTDTMVRKGIYPGVASEFPITPGYDLVGIIDKLGEGVSNYKLGQKVADLSVTGAYTEYAIRPIDYLVTVPDTVEPSEAVSLVLSYTTAYQMLHRLVSLQAGQTILIHGASGAVGMALAQLGKANGLKMYGTASTAKQNFVRKLGVSPIDYKTEDFVEKVMEATNQQGVDIVFDAVSVDNFKRSFSTLKPGGKLVTYGFYSQSLDSKSEETFAIMKEFFSWMWLQFKWNWLPSDNRSAVFYSITDMRSSNPEWFKQDLATLFNLLAEGTIEPKLWKVLPLSEVVTAHKLLEGGQVQGKIVLKVSNE